MDENDLVLEEEITVIWDKDDMSQLGWCLRCTKIFGTPAH